MFGAQAGPVVPSPIDAGESDAEREIEREILGYLAGHPSAKDTLEGVVAWWLPEHRIERTLSEVKRALDRLVARKAVLELHRLDGHTFYCIAADDAKAG